MACTTNLEADHLELDTWMSTATPSSTPGTRPTYQRFIDDAGDDAGDDDDLDDNMSDSDEEFVDAQDHVDDDQDSEDRRLSFNSTDEPGKKRSISKACHKLNSILITLGMAGGLIFAYYQYKQQVWSNKMSALQTCATLEQASSSIANSTFCAKVLQQGIRRSELRIEQRLDHVHPHGYQLKLSFWFEVTVVLVLSFVFVFGINQAYPFRQRILYDSEAFLGNQQFAPPIHVLNEVARFKPNDLVGTETDTKTPGPSTKNYSLGEVGCAVELHPPHSQSLYLAGESALSSTEEEDLDDEWHSTNQDPLSFGEEASDDTWNIPRSYTSELDTDRNSAYKPLPPSDLSPRELRLLSRNQEWQRQWEEASERGYHENEIGHLGYLVKEMDEERTPAMLLLSEIRASSEIK